MELRFKFGPGYRLYYSLAGNELILLLLGGDKGSQKKDIEEAKKHWRQYQETVHGKM